MPQSNQRGIETEIYTSIEGDRLMGLNRTSVGLKPDKPSGPIRQPAGLNRTSVGLKLIWHAREQ